MSTIFRRVREREVQRQIRYNRIKKTVVGRLPALLPEFLKMLLGSALGFGIIAELLRYFADAKPMYVLPVLGLVYSMQASYYKYKLSVNPDYRIPKCRCGGVANDKTEVVLQSRGSAILRIPTSMLGTGLYAALLFVVYLQHEVVAMQLAIVAVLGSAYLSYVMVVKIASLCPTCINIAALNVLILLQFVR